MKAPSLSFKGIVRLAVPLLIVMIIGFSVVAVWLQDWLWMRQVGYVLVFWRLLSIKLVLAGSAFILSFLTLWLNFRLALSTIFQRHRNADDGAVIIYTRQGFGISVLWFKAAAFLFAAFIGCVFFSIYFAQWDLFLRFHWGGAFGQTDPVFGRDIGFYVFRLPFYELIRNSLLGLTLLTLVLVVLAYLQFGTLGFGPFRSGQMDRKETGHILALLFFFAAILGWGCYLDRFELLYSPRGVVYGVGYTAFHIEQLGLWGMLFASVVLALMIGLTFIRRRLVWGLVSAGGYLILYFLVLVLLPGLVQKFIVEPNELQLETPYLKNNIEFTRKAFGLDRIVEKAYPALNDLSLEAINDNRTTIDNIRLWDWRPILQTYRQTQEIRLYYQFYSVDVDRYHLEDGYHQVMLSARELAGRLPEKARTWVNRYLQFTHGYGMVMSFVAKQEEGGLPVYLLKDIPPVSDYNLKIDQPAVYYGEKTPDYRIVSTQIKEFDYPKGNDNVYTRYKGKGGIPLYSIWKRLLFAWTQSDINILLTSYLTPESRIQIYRGVRERASQIAPFLAFDHDPYLVLAQGRLYWIEDAYTLSNRFPYSEPIDAMQTELNYIRNSVKVVVDVYDGTVDFYAMDAGDPILKLYRRAFSGMFKDLSQMPANLKSHLRYPRNLFAIQADTYMNYHMTDPQVFYNQEDLWTMPREKYAGESVVFEPYYLLMRLPDTKEIQYLLMTPFTPQGRDNMIAWMGAKCDFPEYGKIIVYQLPKERLTFGPIQIEAMIDQNAVISEQLSLWDQRGSRVIRGNLVVIPIDHSILYVEPVYLLAEGVNIPQLVRVIVVSGKKVVMQPTLDQAIDSVFGTNRSPGTQPAVSVPAEADALSRAREGLDKAREALRTGRWDDFGKAMQKLQDTLSPKKVRQ
jgi:uncharacterized protein